MGIIFGMNSREKTLRKSLYYREEKSIGSEKLEVTVSASGKDAGRLLEMAKEMTDRFFREAQKELRKGASEESPMDGN